MGKKPQHHTWPEAIKLCRLNRNDVEMAKRLGFRPDTLVRARPDPKQKWKLPVNDWVRDLHFKRFGHVIGEKPLPPVEPVEIDPEEQRRFEEELFWEDYRQRNQDDRPSKKRTGTQS